MPSPHPTDIVHATVQRITAAAFDPRTSPWEHRVCVLVHAAQGIIDNGGFEYFFEAPFDGDPDMADFAKAFQAIGASESSAAMESAVRRNAVAASTYDDLNAVMWANSDDTFRRLAAYIAERPSSYA